jgi:pimeloyl-ACP methyl ester carboxylesterase
MRSRRRQPRAQAEARRGERRRPRARELQAAWPGARLTFVPHAGHMPQLENPAAFVEAVAAFVDAG